MKSKHATSSVRAHYRNGHAAIAVTGISSALSTWCVDQLHASCEGPVNDEIQAGHVACRRARRECDDVCDFMGLRHPPHWNHLDRGVKSFGFLLLDPIPTTAVEERRTWTDDIGPNPLGSDSSG